MTQDSPDVVELQASPSWLTVSPAAGGSITRYSTIRDQTTYDWLRPAASNAVHDRSAGATSSFPMVPYSNRIRDAVFRFRGRQVQLPQNFRPEPHAIHGHAWRSPWDVVSQSNSTLTIEYRHAADTWPWAYRAEQTFSLTATHLTVQFSVTNDAAEPMPIGFGLHPYFVRTPRVRLHAEVGRMWRAGHDVMPVALVDPPPEVAFGRRGLNPDAHILDNNFIKFGGRARVEWPEWNAHLDIAADPIYSCLVIYTPKGGDFFCVEPATNCIDAFNLADHGRTDTGLVVLEPGDTMAGDVSLTPVFLA